MWEEMGLCRVYTKPQGQQPDFEGPVVLSADRGGCIVEDFGNHIHRSLIKDVKYVLVWGTSARHCPKHCGLSHLLQDEDVVQIVKKKGASFGYWLSTYTNYYIKISRATSCFIAGVSQTSHIFNLQTQRLTFLMATCLLFFFSCIIQFVLDILTIYEQATKLLFLLKSATCRKVYAKVIVGFLELFSFPRVSSHYVLYDDTLDAYDIQNILFVLGRRMKKEVKDRFILHSNAPARISDQEKKAPLKT